MKSKILCVLMLIIAISGCGFSKNINDMGLNRSVNVVMAGERGFRSVLVPGIVEPFEVEIGIDGIPENLASIIINMSEAIDFGALSAFIEKKGLNIISVNDDKDKKFMISNYDGSLIHLLKGIEKAAGIDFIYANGILIAKKSKRGIVRVMSGGSESVILGVIKAFGVSDAYYDDYKQLVIFDSDVMTYRKIKNYFESQPLYVATVSIALIESEVSKDEKVGIDWQMFAGSLNLAGGLGKLIKFSGASSGAFTLSAAGDMINLSGVLNSLESFRKYNVIQNASISIISGENGLIDVSNKVPYVSEIGVAGMTVSTGNVSSSSSPVASGVSSGSAAANSLMQSTKFGEISSGLVIDLSPIVIAGLVKIDLDLKYNSVKEFLDVGTRNNMISRPVVSSKSLKTSSVVVPGDVVSVGSMRYSREYKAQTGLWSFLNWGSRQTESKYFEIVALMSCQVVEYRVL